MSDYPHSFEGKAAHLGNWLKSNDIIDFDLGVKITGARTFQIYKGKGPLDSTSEH